MERVKTSWGRDSMLLKDLFEPRRHRSEERRVGKESRPRGVGIRCYLKTYSNLDTTLGFT